jgi:hypothetical protein
LKTGRRSYNTQLTGGKEEGGGRSSGIAKAMKKTWSSSRIKNNKNIIKIKENSEHNPRAIRRRSLGESSPTAALYISLL